MSTENHSSYVLWLPSWYPNKFRPFDGDFIQRHAQAISPYIRLTIIYFYQYGQKESPNEDKIEINESRNLKEIIVSFSFFKTGVSFLDKIIYNLKFFFTCKKYLKTHFRENGLPRLVHVHVPMKAGLLALWIKKKGVTKFN